MGRMEEHHYYFFETVMFLEFLNDISTYVNCNFSYLMMFTIKIMQ